MAHIVDTVWPDGQRRSVPALWLRDNCPCETCRVRETDEHRALISTVPIDLEPVAVALCDDTLTVDWGDHVSRYSNEWIERVTDQVQRSHPARQPWGPDFSPTRTPLADLDDPARAIEFLHRFTIDGAAIVTDTPTEPGSMLDIVRRWAPTIDVPFGLIHDVFVDPAGYNIAHTAEALPPHNDMASRQYPPSGQALHMLVNDADGGDSVIVDAHAALHALDESDLAILAEVRVGFRQFSDRAETWAREPLVRRDTDGSVISVRYSNQLLQPLDPTDPRTGHWYEAYHRLSATVTNPDHHVRFRLEGGQLLLVDAHRVLHGRAEFAPASGARHLQDVYFDSDDLRNELARLRGAVR